MRILTRIIVIISIASLGALCSCTTVTYRHLAARNVSVGQEDSLNHQFGRATVKVKTTKQEFLRKAGFVRLAQDTLHLRSNVLYDTLHIALDSILSIRCIEDLPIGTTIAASLGGAIGGFLIGKATVDKSNTQFPFGISLIGAVLAGFASYESSKETLYKLEPYDKSYKQK